MNHIYTDEEIVEACYWMDLAILCNNYSKHTEYLRKSICEHYQQNYWEVRESVVKRAEYMDLDELRDLVDLVKNDPFKSELKYIYNKRARALADN